MIFLNILAKIYHFILSSCIDMVCWKVTSVRFIYWRTELTCMYVLSLTTWSKRRRVDIDDVDRLERQAGMGLIGKLMDRHYRRSRLNTEIRFNLADVYVYRSESLLYTSLFRHQDNNTTL